MPSKEKFLLNFNNFFFFFLIWKNFKLQLLFLSLLSFSKPFKKFLHDTSLIIQITASSSKTAVAHVITRMSRFHVYLIRLPSHYENNFYLTDVMHNCMTSVPERITVQKRLETRYVASCRLENANWPRRLNPETDERKELSFTIKIVDGRERLLSSSGEKYSLGKILVQRKKRKKEKRKVNRDERGFLQPCLF